MHAIVVGAFWFASDRFATKPAVFRRGLLLGCIRPLICRKAGMMQSCCWVYLRAMENKIKESVMGKHVLLLFCFAAVVSWFDATLVES